MPQTFVAPSGREYEWQGDSQPTQADIDAIVAYENEIVAREKAEARRAERPRGLSGKPEPVVEPFRPDPAQIRPQATAGAAAGALAGATGRQPPQLPSFRAAFGSDALKSKAAAKFFDKPQAKAPIPKPPAPSPRQAIDDLLRRAFEERAIVPRQGETQEQFQVRQAIAQKEAQVSDGSVVGAIAGGAAGKKTPQITTIQEQRRRGIEAREVPPEELEQAVFEEMIALPEDELRALVDERRTIWERNKGNYTAFKDYEQAQAALEEKLGLRRLLDPINALRGLQLQAHKAVVRDDIPATERLMALVNTVEGVVTIASLGSKSVVAYPAIHGLKAAGRVLKPALVKALQAAGKYTSSAKVAVERAVKSLDDKNLAAFRNALERLNLTDDQLKPVVDDVVKHVEDLSAKLDDATAKQVEGDVPGAVYRSAHQIDTSTSRNVGDIWSIDDDVARIRGKYGLTNSDHKDIKRLKKIIGKPDDDVVVYRASPVNELNSGDWVTTDLIYANDIKRQNGGRVYKYTVKVGDLRLPANLEDNPSSARFSAFQFIKTNEEPGVVIVPKPPKPKQVEGDVPGAVQVKQAEVSAEEGAGRVRQEAPEGKEPWEMTREGAKVHISNALDEAETYAKTHTPPAPQWDNELKASIKKAQKQYDDARKAWDRNPMPTEFQVKRLREAEAKLKDLKERGGKAQADNRANDDFFKKKEAEYLLQKYPDMFEARNEWPFYMGSSRYSDLYYHKDTVAKALREGKPVPPEVLADYPDLAAKYAKETPPAAPPKTEGVKAKPTKPPVGKEPWEIRYDKGVAVGATRGDVRITKVREPSRKSSRGLEQGGEWFQITIDGVRYRSRLLGNVQAWADQQIAAKYAKETPPAAPAPKPTGEVTHGDWTKGPNDSWRRGEYTVKPFAAGQWSIHGPGQRSGYWSGKVVGSLDHAKALVDADIADNPSQTFASIKAGAKPTGGVGKAHKGAEPPEPPAPKPPKPVEDAPRRSTGIANVVQDQEALEGIIQEVEKGSGKSAKYWAEKGESILSGHESGKAIHAEGDYIALARRIAAEETPATGERIGIILAGKARMLRKVLDVQDTIRKLVDDGADKKLIGAAKRDLEAVETQLADYLTDVQVGKGIWSDVGRAMQGGIDIDYGNYVDVLERFIRSGRKPTEREAKQLSAAVNDYQQYVKKVVPSYDPAKETAEQAIQRHIDEQIQKAKAEYILKEVTGKSKPKSGRSLKEIRKSRETTKAALRSAFRKALKPDIGSGLGSLESLIEQAPEIVRLLKRYIAEWVEERVAIKASAELDDLYKHLRDELPDMLEEGADVTDRDIQRLLAGVYDEVAKPRSEVARQVAELKRQSKLLENIDRVTEGDELLLAKTPAESSKKVKRLRTLYNALRVSMGRVDSPPGARDRVEKIIADLDAQLKGDYRNVKTKRVVTNKDLKDQAQSLRKTMRLKDTIYELEDRLRTRNFQKPPKEVKQLTLEQQNLQARADILRDRVRSQLHEANRSTGMKVAHAAASLFRGLKLGQDLGQLRRQGLFVSPLSRTFWVALSKAGKSAFSEEAEHRFLREIEERVLPGERLAAPIRKKAGLSLTTDVVSTEEELSIGRFLSTFKWTRPFARPLERFQRVFINSARADVFDYSVLAGRTDNELLHRARFINNATGRGNVKRVPELLQIVMTSPNYEFSRWGMIGEIPRNPARFLSDLAHGRGVNMGVVDNMRQMATTVGELLGIAGIASMAGYRINLDGDSSDFLKLRKYDDKGKPTDEVWDLTAGIGVRLRDIFRTGKAFEGAEYNKAFDSLIGKTAVRTISPGVRGPVELASVMGQRLKGEEKPTSFFTSFESEETGWSLITPLIWQQAYEAYQRGEPPSRQAFLDALEQYSKELVGTGPQYYKPPQSASTIRIPKELQ